jgi:hypothetical protein
MFRGIFGFNNYLYLVYNLDIIIQFTIFYFIFISLTSSEFLKKTLTISLFCSYTFGLTLVFIFGLNTKLLSEWISLNSFIYVAFIMFKCYESLKYDDLKFLEDKSLLVFLLGLFLYSSCTLLIFSFWNYIKIRETKVFSIFWIIHDIFNILMYSCYSYSFIYNRWKTRFLLH